MSDVITTVLDADGVLVATIDMPGKTMNVFSVELMDALDSLMDCVDTDPTVKSCVITSGKSSFLAGADLVMVRGYTDAARTSDHDAMFAMCGRLGRQFVRLEASAKPWVAAVNGLALGGGLELALACRQRLVADEPKLQLGVPEVRWGLLPGAGGTQRLPRLAGFEPAMDLLLSGRSIHPATAVQLGVFSAKVAAARLIDEAKATARSLQGTPYDPVVKFPRLTQADVPGPGDEAVIAARHGVSAADFAAFPAYSAIVDSVLLGARLPLDEATAVEMRQFLRLMFNPVAGRMVRTLFLERLRAERELAPPADASLERAAIGPISAGRSAWTAALAKLKAQVADATLPADTIELTAGNGRTQRLALRVLGDSTPAADLPFAVLAPAGPYGRVVEIVGPADDSAIVLATKLWALPWRTCGTTSVLQSLAGLPLDQQTAVARAALPQVGDPAFLDVAACLAGVSPAWSGGPLSTSS